MIVSLVSRTYRCISKWDVFCNFNFPNDFPLVSSDSKTYTDVYITLHTYRHTCMHMYIHGYMHTCMSQIETSQFRRNLDPPNNSLCPDLTLILALNFYVVFVSFIWWHLRPSTSNLETNVWIFHSFIIVH